MEQSKRKRLPSPAMVVAIVALFAALAGSAVALQGKNSVKSNDIAPNAVRGQDIRSEAVKSRHIREGKVTAPKLDVFKTGAAAELVSTTSAGPVDLGGPSVTVTVPTDGLVGIFARVEGQATGGDEENGAAQVHLFEPTFLSAGPRIMEYATGGGFQVRQTAPGTGDLDGAAAATRGGMIVLAPPPGTYTFSLRYSAAGGAEAAFAARALWAGVLN